MKKGMFILIALLLVMSQVLGACKPAAAPAVEDAAPAQVAEAPTEVPATPEPTEIPEPVDITLWAQATVTEAGPPPDDWIAYDLILQELKH